MTISTTKRRVSHCRLSNQQIFGELLTFHSSSGTRFYGETCIQKTSQNLHRVKLAESVQREPNDLTSVHLVPGNVGSRVLNGLTGFGKYFVEQRSIGWYHYPLSKVRGNVKSDNFECVQHWRSAWLFETSQRWMRWRWSHNDAVSNAIFLHVLQLLDHCCKTIKWCKS